MSALLKPRRRGFRSLCWLLTILTAVAPSLPTLAQEQPQPLKLQYLAPGSAAVIAVRPRQLLTCEAATMLPVEVLSAASLKELGFDPLEVTQVVVSVTPPLVGPAALLGSDHGGRAVRVEFTVQESHWPYGSRGSRRTHVFAQPRRNVAQFRLGRRTHAADRT